MGRGSLESQRADNHAAGRGKVTNAGYLYPKTQNDGRDDRGYVCFTSHDVEIEPMARPDGHGGRVIKKKYPKKCPCADMKGESVQCDGKCQEWFWFCCLGITVKPPKDEKWYCGACNPAGSIPNWKEDLERHKKRIKGSDGKPVPNMNKTEQLPIVIMPADERAKLKTCRRPCGTPSCNQKDSHDGACDPELALAGNPGSRRSRSGRASSSPTPDATRQDAASTLLMMPQAAGKPAPGNGD